MPAIIFSVLILCTTNYAWIFSDEDTFSVNIPLMCIIFIFSYIIFAKHKELFNFIKQTKVINSVFIIILFVFLFIPMSHISSSLSSDFEERNLARFPNFQTPQHKFNYHFGKDFESWFNDRFFGRNELIIIYNNLNLLLSGDYVKFSDVHFYKSTGWMFTNTNSFGFVKYSKKDLARIIKSVQMLKEFCTQNNIKLYIMVVPQKEIVYREFDKNKFKTPDTNFNKITEQVLKSPVGQDIIYPEKEFEYAKKHDYVFFKTDAHATDFGAYELYRIFMDKAKKDFPDLDIVKLSDYKKSQNNLTRSGFARDEFDEGQYYNRTLIYYPKLLSTKYNFYDYKYIDKISVEDDWGTHQLLTNPAGKHKLFILGDSFQENMSYFLDTSFYKIMKYRGNDKDFDPPRKSNLDMNAFAPIILKFKPDIMFVILYQDSADWLIDMYPESEKK